MLDGKYDLDPKQLGEVAHEAHAAFVPANLHMASSGLRDKFVVKGMRKDALHDVQESASTILHLNTIKPKSADYTTGLSAAAKSLASASKAIGALGFREYHGFAPDMAKQLEPVAKTVGETKVAEIDTALANKTPLTDPVATAGKVGLTLGTIEHATMPWKPDTKAPTPAPAPAPAPPKSPPPSAPPAGGTK
jgi:hypothetical protein